MSYNEHTRASDVHYNYPKDGAPIDQSPLMKRITSNNERLEILVLTLSNLKEVPNIKTGGPSTDRPLERMPPLLELEQRMNHQTQLVAALERHITEIIMRINGDLTL